MVGTGWQDSMTNDQARPPEPVIRPVTCCYASSPDRI